MSRYQIAGGAIVVIGIIGILYGPQGTGPWSTGCIGAAALGLALMIFGGLFGVEEKLKKAVFSNFFKSAIAVVSFFAMMLGMLVIMIYYAGSIVDLRPWLPYAFIGLAAGVFGFYRGDAAAGVLVGLIIAIIGVKLGYASTMELSEASPGADIEGKIEGIIAGFDDVYGWHRLRIRRIGRELNMDIHILLDPKLSIENGHKIAEDVERRIIDKLGWPIVVTIHIDPNTEAMRDASSRNEGAVLR